MIALDKGRLASEWTALTGTLGRSWKTEERGGWEDFKCVQLKVNRPDLLQVCNLSCSGGHEDCKFKTGLCNLVSLSQDLKKKKSKKKNQE